MTQDNTTLGRWAELMREAAIQLDTAFCLSDDDRLTRRYADLRDRITEELRHV